MTVWRSHLHVLHRSLEQLSLVLTHEQECMLLEHLSLLDTWNHTYNLTAVLDKQEQVIRHVLDSLVVCPFLTPGVWLDVGSGAGFPGIPLAIAKPTCSFILLESRIKRVRFLQTVQQTLKLSKLKVVRTRVENYGPEVPIQGLVARAVADWFKVYQMTCHLLPVGGRVLIWLGHVPKTWPDLPGVTRQLHPLTVPGMVGTRHLLELTKEA